jgi:hypothetical protein
MGRRRKTHKRKRILRGGMKPFIGEALNYSNFSTYPGVTNHGGNHYALNQYVTDPYTGNITDESDFSIFPNVYTTGGYVYNKSKSSNKKFSKNYKTYRRRQSSHSRRSKYIKRGGLGPLLNDAMMGSRVIGNDIGNVYNTLAGYPQSVSPLPYKDQLVSSR